MRPSGRAFQQLMSSRPLVDDLWIRRQIYRRHALEIIPNCSSGGRDWRGLARTRLQALAGRGLTPFVGRHTERQALREALARAGTGDGQRVAVIGEPGVGKSRL